MKRETYMKAHDLVAKIEKTKVLLIALKEDKWNYHINDDYQKEKDGNVSEKIKVLLVDHYRNRLEILEAKLGNL